MAINSRTKGAAGERELAKKLTEVLGCEARRGQQFQGSPDSPDVVTSLDGVHIECKRVERFEIYKAMEQAKHDAGGKIPVVCHRKNRGEWLAVVRLEDLPELAKRLSEK